MRQSETIRAYKKVKATKKLLETKVITETNDVKCPDGESVCPSGNTCCKLTSGGYGCCPLPKAVCCKDGAHCCPNGFTCGEGGMFSHNIILS